MKKCIYILLPVHNRREITRDFIDCLVAQTWQNYHLVLIDDGSTDGTDQMVREQVENLTVIRGKGEWWWAGCLQQGFDTREIAHILNCGVSLVEAYRQIDNELEGKNA